MQHFACLGRQLLQDNGGQGTIGPLRRFFGDFSASVPKIRAEGDGFLADRAHTCERSESGFAGERKLLVEDRTRRQYGRECVSASGMQELSLPPTFAAQMPRQIVKQVQQ